nr:venom polypeptide precursor [Doratifera vulnerans]
MATKILLLALILAAIASIQAFDPSTCACDDLHFKPVCTDDKWVHRNKCFHNCYVNYQKYENVYYGKVVDCNKWKN